ncbi:uncharacterized protein KY384_006514 [Bacidia gigantensis]|uniref:uncharacterized protein n=1 Tax=Bacidia gigantensis TaxID=2732470 RepID=UPI001D03DAB2|nr:uncharacterized protein KY384_006514 [Bacidia gigantensis]KAG8528825.1 hypothetical protein KY384_006514 [Bacidia gigantensis]
MFHILLCIVVVFRLHLAAAAALAQSPSFANTSASVPAATNLRECGKCGIEAPGGVQLVYWAPDNVSNGSIRTNQSTSVLDGFTFTSPSVYVVYSSLRATVTCGAASTLQTIGPVFDAKTIGYSSRFLAYGTLSSPDQRCDENVVVDGFHTIDFSSLYYNPIITSTTTKAGCPPYINPRLSLPAELTDVDPSWKSCEPLFYGAFDPPRVIGHADTLAPPKDQAGPVTKAEPATIPTPEPKPVAVPAPANPAPTPSSKKPDAHANDPDDGDGESATMTPNFKGNVSPDQPGLSHDAPSKNSPPDDHHQPQPAGNTPTSDGAPPPQQKQAQPGSSEGVPDESKSQKNGNGNQVAPAPAPAAAQGAPQSDRNEPKPPTHAVVDDTNHIVFAPANQPAPASPPKNPSSLPIFDPQYTAQTPSNRNENGNTNSHGGSPSSANLISGTLTGNSPPADNPLPPPTSMVPDNVYDHQGITPVVKDGSSSDAQRQQDSPGSPQQNNQPAPASGSSAGTPHPNSGPGSSQQNNDQPLTPDSVSDTTQQNPNHPDSNPLAATPPPSSPSAHLAHFALGGAPVHALPASQGGGLKIGSATLSPGTQTTISGLPISLGSSGVIALDGQSYAFITAPRPTNPPTQGGGAQVDAFADSLALPPPTDGTDGTSAAASFTIPIPPGSKPDVSVLSAALPGASIAISPDGKSVNVANYRPPPTSSGASNSGGGGNRGGGGGGGAGGENGGQGVALPTATNLGAIVDGAFGAVEPSPANPSSTDAAGSGQDTANVKKAIAAAFYPVHTGQPVTMKGTTYSSGSPTPTQTPTLALEEAPMTRIQEAEVEQEE